MFPDLLKKSYDFLSLVATYIAMLELIVPAPKIVEGNEPLPQKFPSKIKRTLIEMSEKRRKLLTIWS